MGIGLAQYAALIYLQVKALAVIVVLDGFMHLKCVGLKNAPKSKHWFCRSCHCCVLIINSSIIAHAHKLLLRSEVKVKVHLAISVSSLYTVPYP